MSIATVALFLCFLAPAAGQDSRHVRIGMIGLDTSHSPAFAKIFNDPEAEPDVAGFRVVAAYPYGSRTIESSYSRIPRYTEEVRGLGVEIVDSIDELLDRVDVVLLDSNDGRIHLDQAMQVFRAGKPVFIDKPIAASLEDAVAIFDAAEHFGVPVFSSSSLRYAPGVQAVRSGSVGEVTGADTYSPARIEETHPDLFWYGVHGVEMLIAVMGTGCEEVVRTSSDGADVVTCRWSDGRIGTFRGIRSGKFVYGGTAFGTEDVAELGPSGGYRPLLVEVAEFFRTGVAPVSKEETIEVFAFMEAADESKRRGGAPVKVTEILDQARSRARQSAPTSEPNTLTETERREGWRLLFDGTSFSGWRGLGRDLVPEGHWAIENGAIKKIPGGEVPRRADGQPMEGGDLVTVDAFDDFEFAFDWRISPGGNSGVKYNVSEELSAAHGSRHSAIGFEYQVIDNDNADLKRMSDVTKYTAGGLYDLVGPSVAAERPVGQWNRSRIVVHGNRGEHWLNGVKVVEYELGTPHMDGLVHASKFRDIEGFADKRRGHFVLQDHVDEAWFRNLKIRKLPVQRGK